MSSVGTLKLFSFKTCRFARVHSGDVILQPLHSPVKKAADGLVFILLVWGFNDNSHRTIKGCRVHGSHEQVSLKAGER